MEYDTPPSTSPSRTPSPKSPKPPLARTDTFSKSSASSHSNPTVPDNKSLAGQAAIRQRRNDHHESEILVVGAGILGTALAITFARAPHNRSVTLLEKSLKEPDRIVGELLQPGGVAALRQLGLEDCLEEIDSIRVKGYDVIYYGEDVEIPYPQNGQSLALLSDEEAKRKVRNGEEPRNGRLMASKKEPHSKSRSRSRPKSRPRPEGRSFHHGRFIQRLRQVAMTEPNLTVVESTVTGVVRDDYTNHILGVECMTNGEKDAWFGQLTVMADGYASKFRKEFIPRSVVSKSRFWGLELIDADLPMPNYGHVVLGDGAPVLLYQIGTYETRCLVDVPEGLESASSKNGGVKDHLRRVVLPSLPERVKPAFEKALNEGKLRSMPNSFLPPSINRVPGLVLLGDAMNMRHPLTGGGMTVAFNDVVLLSNLLDRKHVVNFGDSEQILRQMKIFHWKRKNLSSVINILAQALYSLFAANDPQLKALQRGCFHYFKCGGQCVDGPVGLLAGIIRRPIILFYHFFSVAILAIIIHIRQSPVYLLPWTLLSSLAIFYKACLVLFPFIASELRG